MTLQQKLDAINQRLAVTLAAIAAAEAAQRAIDDANRQAVLLLQQQRRDAAEARLVVWQRLCQPYVDLIQQARNKINE